MTNEVSLCVRYNGFRNNELSIYRTFSSSLKRNLFISRCLRYLRYLRAKFQVFFQVSRLKCLGRALIHQSISLNIYIQQVNRQPLTRRVYSQEKISHENKNLEDALSFDCLLVLRPHVLTPAPKRILFGVHFFFGDVKRDFSTLRC